MKGKLVNLRDYYRVEATFPGLPLLPNQIGIRAAQGMKRKRNTQKWRGMVSAYFNSLKPKSGPLKKFQITCIRYGASEPDYDGLVASFKPLIDGLKVAGIIEDDRRSFMIDRPDYRFIQVPRKSVHNPNPDYKVTIIVEDQRWQSVARAIEKAKKLSNQKVIEHPLFTYFEARIGPIGEISTLPKESNQVRYCQSQISESCFVRLPDGSDERYCDNCKKTYAWRFGNAY